MGELPLDDPHWWPMKAAIELRRQQTGDLGVAVLDLERDMGSDELPSMRRSRAGNERERLSASFWKGHVLDFSLHAVEIYRRTAIDSTPRRWGMFAHDPDQRVVGHVYYVWKPEFDRLYLGIMGEEPDEPEGDGWQVARVKKLLPIVFPDGVPGDVTDKAVQQRLVSECKTRGWKLPSLDSIARARGRRR